MATKFRAKVKASNKTGIVQKPARKRKPAEQLVHEAVWMDDLYNGVAGGFTAAVGLAAAAATTVADGVTTTLSAVIDKLAEAAGVVWRFMGKVYDTVLGYFSAVLNWLGDQITTASGKVREAYQYVSNLVSSMSIDWVAVNGAAVNLLCGAAALGVGVTTGALVGTTAAGITAKLVGLGNVPMLTGVLFAAITANCVATACYTLFKAGFEEDEIRAADVAAQAEHAAGRRVVVNAVAVQPA